MKKMVCVFQPFDMKQTIYTVEDKEVLNIVQVNADEVINMIFSLAKNDNIKMVDLKGPALYVKGIKNKIQQEEISKYDKNTLVINII